MSFALVIAVRPSTCAAWGGHLVEGGICAYGYGHITSVLANSFNTTANEEPEKEQYYTTPSVAAVGMVAKRN